MIEVIKSDFLEEKLKEVGRDKSKLIPKFVKDIDCKITSFKEADNSIKNTLAENQNNKRMPKEFGDDGEERGKWKEEKGNSLWTPNREIVPRGKGTNEEGLTWGEILDKNGIEGIPFKDGEPDFSKISKETVEIDGFTDDRRINFKKADMEAAEKRGCSPQEVKEWRKENGYTWHEKSDCKTMEKVPAEVHGNIPHSGGISEYKKGEANNA